MSIAIAPYHHSSSSTAWLNCLHTIPSHMVEAGSLVCWLLVLVINPLVGVAMQPVVEVVVTSNVISHFILGVLLLLCFLLAVDYLVLHVVNQFGCRLL